MTAYTYAKHIKHYDGILIDFSHDQQLTVREAVASNRQTPVNILHHLSQEDEALPDKTNEKWLPLCVICQKRKI